MQNDTVTSTASSRPANAISALSTEPKEQAPAQQRVADAAAKRPSPVDQAQLSPLARKLSENDAGSADPAKAQQRTDERLQPERQQAGQQQGQVAAQKRFEVVA